MRLTHIIIARLILTQFASLFFLTGAVLSLIKTLKDEVAIFYFMCACCLVVASIMEIPMYVLDEHRQPKINV